MEWHTIRAHVTKNDTVYQMVSALINMKSNATYFLYKDQYSENVSIQPHGHIDEQYILFQENHHVSCVS